MEAKLLRVLQKREFERVGGEETIKVDVRIIAATNKDLEEMVARGEFREDLYYRLNVIPIILVPLRERKEDIPLLVEHFLQQASKESGKEIKGIRSDALEVLMSYRWPGNVRELENIIERITILIEKPYIEIQDLAIYLRQEADINQEKASGGFSQKIILPWEEYEKQIIKMALEKYSSYNAAAKALGLTHKTIAAKARKYGIEK
jgi:transcriptional regulator with PAS, ATPase and Fis domain